MDLVAAVARLAAAGAFDLVLLESTGVSEPLQVRTHAMPRCGPQQRARCVRRRGAGRTRAQGAALTDWLRRHARARSPNMHANS
jgi:hypothetical protein